jgi:hypothetical protein
MNYFSCPYVKIWQSGDVFGVTSQKAGTASIPWLEARDAAKQCVMYRKTPSKNKELLNPQISIVTR